MSEEVCECFTCANRDNMMACKAYDMGYFSAMKEVMMLLKNCGINTGRLSDEADTFSHMFAVVDYEMSSAACILQSELYKEIHFKGALERELYGNEDEHQ